MNIALKNMVSSRVFLPALAIAVLLICLEWFYYQSVSMEAESDLLPVLPSVSQKTAGQHAPDEVVDLFSAYDQSDTGQATSGAGAQLMTVEQQAKQQGLLKVLYSADQSYQLIAILHQQQYRAVLSVQGEQNSSRITLQLGDRLAEYSVTDVTERRITLSAGDRKVWLELFTPISLSTQN